MAKEVVKQGLLISADEQYKKLWKLVDGMSAEEQTATFLFEDRDKNLRDIFIHLYEWHQLLLNWVDTNTGGGSAPFLPAPYNWKTYPAMNVEFWRSHQNTPYEKSKELFRESHKKTIDLIERLSEEELFTRCFPWTGNHTLAVYLSKNTSSHYEWAMKKIKKHIKSYREK